MSRGVTPIYALLVAASVLLGLGLVAPCMTVRPSMGADLDTLLRLLRPEELQPKTYSLLSGILQVMREDSAALGVLLFGFTVVFPAVKLATLWVGVGSIRRGRPGGALLWFTHHAGKFSMLDVLVLGVLIIAIKGLPGESEVTIGWGLFAFAGSVLLSMVASLRLKRLEAVSPDPSP